MLGKQGMLFLIYHASTRVRDVRNLSPPYALWSGEIRGTSSKKSQVIYDRPLLVTRTGCSCNTTMGNEAEPSVVRETEFDNV